MATFLFDTVQKLGARGIGPKLRSFGFKLYQSGLRIGRSDITFESVQPKNDRIMVGDKSPQTNKAKLIGQGTSLMGDVTVGEGSTIQFNNIIQAGPNGGKVVIGSNTVINDLVIIKADQNSTVHIGNNVFIGSNAYLRNCTVKDNAFVGIGAKAYDGSVIEGTLGAGSVLLEGEKVPEGEIWVGNPAVFVRKVTEEERDHNTDLATQYSKLADIVKEELSKSLEDKLFIENMRDDPSNSDMLLKQYRIIEHAKNEGLPVTNEDFTHVKRLFDIEYVEDKKKELADISKTEDYNYNYDEFPQNFNAHKSNYRIHNELKGRAETDAEMQRPDYSTFENKGENTKPENWTRKY